MELIQLSKYIVFDDTVDIASHFIFYDNG